MILVSLVPHTHRRRVGQSMIMPLNEALIIGGAGAKYFNSFKYEKSSIKSTMNYNQGQATNLLKWNNNAVYIQLNLILHCIESTMWNESTYLMHQVCESNKFHAYAKTDETNL